MKNLMKDEFLKPNIKNAMSYNYYFDRLTEIALSRFKWLNLPDTMDERTIEMSMICRGSCLFFRDDILGDLSLPCNLGGTYNVYNVPINRMPVSANNYIFEDKDKSNSVLIYNNYLRMPTANIIYYYSERLFELDRAIDVNTNAQKTPILVICNTNTRLTLKNIYKQYEGNAPVIFENKDNFNPDAIKVLNTGAPYVADRLKTLSQQLWNDALTCLGVSNLQDKKERYTNYEIDEKNNDADAALYSALECRKNGCKKYNEMYGTNIDCEIREEWIKNVSVYNRAPIYSGEPKQSE